MSLLTEAMANRELADASFDAAAAELAAKIPEGFRRYATKKKWIKADGTPDQLANYLLAITNATKQSAPRISEWMYIGELNGWGFPYEGEDQLDGLRREVSSLVEAWGGVVRIDVVVKNPMSSKVTLFFTATGF